MNLNNSISKRYTRQVQLSEVGEAGQLRIAQSSVLIVGLGGLGCPAAQYLAAAGIGRLGLMDFDTVDMSNLHRQLLYSEKDIGRSKSDAAAEVLRRQFPNCDFIPYQEVLSNLRALELFAQYDLIIDATDQVPARYMINDACLLLSKPWIYGSVNGFEGQWALFQAGSVDYRDVFPQPPNPLTMQTCANGGVLGMVPGIVGTFQALEAFQFLSGMKREQNIFHNLNMQTGSSYEFNIGKSNREILTESIFLNRDYLKYVLEFHYKKNTNHGG